MKILKRSLNKFICWVKDFIHNYKIDKLIKESEKPLNSTIYNEDIFYGESHRQEKLGEALTQVKNSVKKESQGNVKVYLGNNPDLTKHAQVTNEIVDIIRKGWNLSNQDVRSESDKEKMIDKRINHYYQLQAFNEERALIKKIKEAKKQGQVEIYNALYEEWTKKYGNSSKVSN